jgi:hypothetical protein
MKANLLPSYFAAIHPPERPPDLAAAHLSMPPPPVPPLGRPPAAYAHPGLHNPPAPAYSFIPAPGAAAMPGQPWPHPNFNPYQSHAPVYFNPYELARVMQQQPQQTLMRLNDISNSAAASFGATFQQFLGAQKPPNPSANTSTTIAPSPNISLNVMSRHFGSTCVIALLIRDEIPVVVSRLPVERRDVPADRREQPGLGQDVVLLLPHASLVHDQLE